MHRKHDFEMAVGVFVLLGILALGYLSVKLGKLDVVGSGGYTVYAGFSNAGGVKQGSAIEIAGVEIGKVRAVRLVNYSAQAEFWIHKDVKLQEDAIATIKTKGLIGEKFIQINPGGSETYLKDGEKIRETESAVDIEELVSKFIFGKV